MTRGIPHAAVSRILAAALKPQIALEDWRWQVWFWAPWVGLLMVAIAAGCYILGCAAAPVASYEAQQLACIDHATTRTEADACRCAVQRSYGRPCTAGQDGGAP